VLGLSRPGACSPRKAPTDSSPVAPSLPLPPAALTEFPQLPPHGRSTSRSCSLRGCDGPLRCYPPRDRSPPRVSPPLGLACFPVPQAPRRVPEASAHGVSANVWTRVNELGADRSPSASCWGAGWLGVSASPPHPGFRAVRSTRFRADPRATSGVPEVRRSSPSEWI
jgi:hypothetical protein